MHNNSPLLNFNLILISITEIFDGMRMSLLSKLEITIKLCICFYNRLYLPAIHYSTGLVCAKIRVIQNILLLFISKVILIIIELINSVKYNTKILYYCQCRRASNVCVSNLII